MNKKQTGLALLCFLGLLASSLVLQAQEPVEIMAGEILLKFKSDTPEAAKRTFEKEFDLNLVRESKATGVCLYQSKQDDVLLVVERIKKSPLIEFAEPNYVVKKTALRMIRFMAANGIYQRFRCLKHGMNLPDQTP